MEDDSGLWIFGYGSLCWNPGFEFERSTIGYIRGYGRKFWQGNSTHRGTVEKPGRVATLVEDKEGIVYGRAFEVKDSVALPYLEKRECTLGGYRTIISTFHTRNGKTSFPVIIYTATDQNEHWLGDASLHSIARQIFECVGPSGHNVEYLLRLADFMHYYLPEIHDEHLFTLEALVRARIKETNVCLVTLMGNRDYVITIDDHHNDLQDEERAQDENVRANNAPRQNSFEYTSRVEQKQLRCIKM
ncbi:putative glutathione-specific gamma-glutamylcyclotransferase 2 [Venturia canescens]|uniref:putative glutathione-specific gamma-glutamylcyclotransferase 2 n=1 Tax=Venturia canescens TaxID=32260 RepID=UPI001C9C7FF2|nr:putative glutathione-specific gamma-glutamylcyclotransferase 2 [Venturia canescens]